MAQSVINAGLYRQVGASGSSPALRQRGIDCWVAGLMLRATFQSPLQLRGVVHGVINGGLYRQGMGIGCYQWWFI
ncbi:MAG: hypothetical protein K2G49_07970 [Muribaculum sp.]|nr:hypothetical protein [Muribaculum sp.]